MKSGKSKSPIASKETSEIIQKILELSEISDKEIDPLLDSKDIVERIKLIHDSVSSLQSASLSEMEIMQNVFEHLKKENELLKEESYLLRDSQNYARIGSFVFDIINNRWQGSDEVERIFGISEKFPRTIEGWKMLVHPDDLPLVAEYFNLVAKEKQNFCQDYRIIRYNDKAERWISEIGEIDYAFDGTPVKLIGFVQDVTERKNLEMDLLESEEQYRGLFDNSVVGIYQTLPDGSILRANKSLCDMLGFASFDELRERNLEKEGFLSDFSRTAFKERIETDGLIEGRESIWIHRNGERVYVRENARVVKDQSGNTLYYEGTVENITEKKLAEKALQENTEFLNLQSHRMPIALIYWDEKGSLTSCNPAALKLFRYSIEEAIGKQVGDFFVSTTIRDNLKIFSERFIAGDILPQCNNENITKDGRIINCEWTNIPFNDNEGKLAGFISMIQDITLRVQSEQALRESEIRYRTLAHCAPFPVILIHQIENTILYANTAALNKFEISKNEVFGRHIQEFCPTPDFWKTSSARLKVEETIKPQEIELRSFSGKKFWALADLSFTQYANQPAIFISLYDITERKKIEETLFSAKHKAEELNVLKSNFLANMSHELRTPLIGILGYSEMMGEIVHNAEEAGFVNVIHENGLRLLDTLNQLLDLTKIQTEKISVESTNVDIVALVKRGFSLFELSALKKQLHLQLKTNKAELFAHLDKIILSQIINNILNNAIKFTKAGSVVVTVDEVIKYDRRYILISVQDTGIGIPFEKQSEIWNDFRQASEGFGRSFEGVGLGLAIVRKFTEALHGEIILESEPGKGSTFTLLLPDTQSELSNSQYENQDIQADADLANAEKPTAEVLYVENDPVAVEVVKRFLQYQCSIDPVENLEQVVEKIKTKRYAAILMDINLGEGPDGLDVTRYIRTFPEYEKIPIIAITAFAMAGDKEEFLQKGCTHYISKPFKKNDLQKLMAEVLAF